MSRGRVATVFTIHDVHPSDQSVNIVAFQSILRCRDNYKENYIKLSHLVSQPAESIYITKV